jgi:predicted outer membrane protein
MHKYLTLAAAVAMVGFAGVANAADTMTTKEMDTVTAGAYGSGGTGAPRTVYFGAFKLVFDGSHWTLVRK